MMGRQVYEAPIYLSAAFEESLMELYRESRMSLLKIEINMVSLLVCITMFTSKVNIS